MSRDEGSSLESLFPFYVLLTVCSIAALPFVSEQTILAFERLGRWETLALVIGLGVFGVFNQFAKSLATGTFEIPLIWDRFFTSRWLRRRSLIGSFTDRFQLLKLCWAACLFLPLL